MRTIDITSIDCSDECFDAIVCHHVLEHVPNDRKALSELYRVLKSGGWASIQVPIKRDTTFEDAEANDPESRMKYYGQADHVRIYGGDFIDRLRSAGFTVECYPKEQYIPPALLPRLSVDCEQVMWVCRK